MIQRLKKWGVLTLIVCSPTFSSANDLTKALAELLFQNECGGKQANLVYWSKNEPFPSLGIGHFIWLPKSQQSLPFEETFPQLMQFLQHKSNKIPQTKIPQTKIPESPVPPAWLVKLNPFEPPWANRTAFLAQQTSPQVTALRTYLWQTRDGQAEFVVQHFQQHWQKVIQGLPESKRAQLQSLLNTLMQTPKGQLMVLDYSNFKGFGYNAKEQYHHQGWGLIEVLSKMIDQGSLNQTSPQALQRQFIQAAKAVLLQRVANAPKLVNGESSEQHWLTGWFRRLDRLAK